MSTDSFLITILVALLILGLATEASSACVMSYCKDRPATCAMSYCKDRSTRTITNPQRQKVGDLYDPGHGQRIQIRDADRRILGYIEPSGRITNTYRQKIGEINE